MDLVTGLGLAAGALTTASLVPQVLGSIRALFPTEAELAKALSVYGVMMGLAASIGQFAGGALVEWSPFGLGWRAVFLSKLPLGIEIKPRTFEFKLMVRHWHSSPLRGKTCLSGGRVMCLMICPTVKGPSNRSSLVPRW